MFCTNKILFEIYNENSILTINKIIDWKKNQRVYNFKKLPKTVVLTSTTNYIHGFKKFITKKMKGLSGKNYLIKKNVLLSSNFGNGAPVIISHMEELKALGVENFIFIGFAGMLNNNLTECKAFIINKAFSASGTSFFYNQNEEINYQNILSQSLKLELNLSEKIIVSTDAPFRETKTFISNYKTKGVDLIDMETASILAFSMYYKINCACIVVASDKIEDNQWFPPKNMKALSDKIKSLIHELIKL